MAFQRIVPPPPGQWPSWEALMERALVLADVALGQGEVPVGALVVTASGEVVGEGCNASISRNDPTAHAEIMALRDAGTRLGNYRLEGCLLVVTLEPCLMCVGAMSHARIAGVVYGALDARAGAVESCGEACDLAFLNHRVWHLGGICGKVCTERLRHFFLQRR